MLGISSETNFNRVQCSRKMLTILQRLKRDEFRYFTTGDESFFMWDSVKKQIWLPIDQEPPKKSTDKHESTKIMICIFWSPNGIQVLKYLPEGETFNSSFFIDEILKEILKNTYARDAKKNKKLFYVHFDNAPSHKSSEVNQFCIQNKLTLMIHPPYSPDLAPSVFSLFGYTKEKCEGVKFTSPDQLIEYISEIFSNISIDLLQAVFQNWEERLLKCINAKGYYF